MGDFKQHFIKNFPYGMRDTPKHKKKVDLKRLENQLVFFFIIANVFLL